MSDNHHEDLLGVKMTADEIELLSLYRRLQELSGREDLAPCAVMNARQAMVMLWNACTDLRLICEEPGTD